ncbi:Zinc finger protein zpr1 [Hypsizygus marmoreus]|uniref:Zinc finger protein zpr1 n=1 Tax=Hypsizygus marmoreus TaxID=39966 RepID=A0A369KE95_HYPMA|nr:Zinc finger protein zpr1 [Hypsizygus marmoreus]
MAEPKPLFPKIGTLATQAQESEDKDVVQSSETPTTTEEDTEEKVVQEIPSLCMSCREQGVTRLMLTSIPYFREVIVMSFRCEHCGATNNEIQSAGTIQVEGTQYTAKILTRIDLDRQIVRSPSAEISIPELELTLPPTSRGQLTTVEGLIRDVIADLNIDQPLRRIQDEAGYKTIEALLGKLRAILGDHEEAEDKEEGGDIVMSADKDAPVPPFTLRLDDPAGNSWIEFIGSMSDPHWSMKSYRRTFEQNVSLGLVSPDEAAKEGLEAVKEEEVVNGEVTDDEVFVFHGTCSSCGHPVDTNMKKVIIPYFKDILIMSTNCERCGYRDNEVKSGSAISQFGKKITLKVEDREDLSRDILKSETAGMTIPEIDMVLEKGSLGGRFTTLEGILDQVYDELSSKAFASGDAVSLSDKDEFDKFLERLKQIKTAETPFTVILDDPLANSYVQNLYAPDPDPNLKIEQYERSWQDNEDLGLNDIKVEGYEADAQKEQEEKEKKEKADKVDAELAATPSEVS